VSWLRLALALALPLVALVALGMTSNTDYHRYGHDRLPCLLRIMNTGDEPIDLVTFGGSRMMAAFDPVAYARQAAGNNSAVNAINLAKVWSGADFELVAFEELLARRPVKHALIAMTHPNDRVYHAWTPGFWRNRDFIAHLGGRDSSPVSHTGTMLGNYLQRIAQTLFADHRRMKDRHRGYGERQDGFISDRTCYRRDEDKGNPEKHKRALDRFRSAGTPQAIKYPNRRSFRYHRHFYEKIRQIAEHNGTHVELLILPGLNDARYLPDSLATLSEELGMTVIQPPADLMRELSPDGYRDGAHLNAAGRQIFTRWLASRERN